MSRSINMAATVGLAQVRKSADKAWLKWAVIFPCDRKTEWFATEDAAENVKRNYNGANL